MCGIAVIVNPIGKDNRSIEQMLKQIEHRGDTKPIHIKFGNSILGSVRLKIVDKEMGIQPIFNEDKTVAIVFNGEIYNYLKLRNDLVKKGHKFSTNSDTEVLVHLYEEYENNFLHLLEGMFSFFIYDIKTHKFFGARDFFGVKPFFYCTKGNTLFVSSEMKSFFHLDVKEYKELKPGHYLTNKGVYKYYYGVKNKWHDETLEKISIKVRQLLDEAVRKRVQTDLPIAVFLSGGVDSTIVFLLALKYHKDVTAIIVGNESSEDVIFATRFCKKNNFKYHLVVTKNEELIKKIPIIIYAIETFEPNPIRGSILSMKLAEKAHKEGFKIVLCGEGSDEIFGGYADFLSINKEKDFNNKIMEFLNDLYRTQLLRIDRTGMQYGVEVREPFLDRKFVEYVLNIHPKYKVTKSLQGKLITKYILREAFKDILPADIYKRDKMTLMEGAGIGNVEQKNGLLFEFANKYVSDTDYYATVKKYKKYDLIDKEEVYCFNIFKKNYLKAKFASTRVINAKKEINDN